MRKKLILSLIAICCCGAFLVGCGSDDAGATPTATAKTPLQVLNESTTAKFADVWTQLNTKASNADLSALANRVGTLEGQTDLATFAANDSDLKARVAVLESLNISSSLTNILAEIAFLKLQSPTATPTPTPTPTIQCGIHRPVAIYPDSGNVSIPNGSILFQWEEEFNAVSYEFFLGTDSSAMTSRKVITDYSVTNYLYPINASNTYYFWKIIVTDGCGEKQTDSWWFKTSP